MSTSTTASKRAIRQSTLTIAILLLIAVPPLIPRGNPYASVIEDIATSSDWDATSIQMMSGRNTDVSFLRWTRVEIVVHSASSETPIYATVQKLPFSNSYISCWSAGASDPCFE